MAQCKWQWWVRIRVQGTASSYDCVCKHCCDSMHDHVNQAIGEEKNCTCREALLFYNIPKNRYLNVSCKLLRFRVSWHNVQCYILRWPQQSQTTVSWRGWIRLHQCQLDRCKCIVYSLPMNSNILHEVTKTVAVMLLLLYLQHLG